MQDGSIYVPKKISKIFGINSLMVISYRKLFLMAINDKLWPNNAEIVADPIGKCFNKLFRHCCF